MHVNKLSCRGLLAVFVCVHVCFPSRVLECCAVWASHTGMKPRWQRPQSKQYVPCATLPEHQQKSVCACVNSRRGSCPYGILICQVGLIKSSIGREGVGGDLP